MGAWKQILFRMCLIFVGNGCDQTGSAEMFSDLSVKIKRHVTYRRNAPFRRGEQKARAGSVLIEIV